MDDAFNQFWNKFKMPGLGTMNWQSTLDQLRDGFAKASASVESDLPDLAEISNLVVDGTDGPLKARLYVPLAAGIGPAPAILFFHGGGFVMGDLDSYDIVCRRLAAGARCRLISVDYSLAPEHKFPTAHKDAEASWHWLIKNSDALGIDPDRIAVSGDSAGGNLATFICQQMGRTDGPMPSYQLLFYPLVQFADIRAEKLSFQEGGFFISQSLFDYFRACYLDDERDYLDPRVSPLFADEDDFRGQPPTHLVLCGWDPLKHEGAAYASKLAAHGVPVTIKEHPGMVHGFLNLTGVSTPARKAIKDAGETVGRALGARPL